jgi:hypothetical protein
MDDENSGRKYNGWSSYETWVVKLWLDNEEPSYRHWTEQARRWHGRDGAKSRLADQLKEELADGSPANEPTVYGDLMNAALEDVNWLEIAESYLEDLDEGGTVAEGRRDDRRPAKDALPADVAKAVEDLLWYLWQDEQEAFIAEEPEPCETTSSGHWSPWTGGSMGMRRPPRSSSRRSARTTTGNGPGPGAPGEIEGGDDDVTGPGRIFRF